MPVEIEIEIKSPVSNTQLLELRELLAKHGTTLNDVSVKTKPALPNQMSGSILECVITAAVEGVVSVGIEQFFSKVWEPHISPVIEKWRKGNKEEANPEIENRAFELGVSVKEGNSKSYFTENGNGSRQVYEDINYSINTDKTFVILIGCSDYKYDLNNIPPVKGNIDDMFSLFTEKRFCGIPPQNVFTSINESSDSIKDLLYTKSRLPGIDTLIIYYAGHGYRAGAKELYLTAVNSKKLSDTEFLGAVEYDFIKNSVIRGSKAKQKILILDACHSGIAAQSYEDSFLEVEGTYVLASSQGDEPSYFNPTDRNTYFTGAIVELFKTGIDSTKEMLSLNDIYQRSKQILSEKKFPVPIQLKDINIPTENYLISLNSAFSIEKLKARPKNLFYEGKEEDAMYEIELLLKRYPADSDLQKMKMDFSQESLYNKFIQKAHNLFYENKDYAGAAENYKKALKIKDNDTNAKENLRVCREKLSLSHGTIQSEGEHSSNSRAASQSPGKVQTLSPSPSGEIAEYHSIPGSNPGNSNTTTIKRKKNPKWVLSFAVFVTLIAAVLVPFAYFSEKTFDLTLQLVHAGTVIPSNKELKIKYQKNSDAVAAIASIISDDSGKAVFKDLPSDIEGSTAEIELLGQLKQGFRINPNSQKILLKAHQVISVQLIKKDSGDSIPSQPDFSNKTKKYSPLSTNSSVAHEEKTYQPAIDLQAASFEATRNTDKLNFSGATGSVLSFSGTIGGYSMSGKMKLSNNRLTIVSGNVSGALVLNNDEISGSISIKEFANSGAKEFRVKRK